MILGVPREIKANEYRVALLPVGAELLAADGHTVLVERSAGLDAGDALAVNMRSGKLTNPAVADAFELLPRG